jgi:WD40 repeat protein
MSKTPIVLLTLFLAATIAAPQPAAIQPANARAAETLGGLAGPGFAIAYGEKDGTLVAACEHRCLHCWQRPTVIGVRTGDRSPHVLSGHEGPITALAWDGGPTLASAGADQKTLLWSMPEGKVRATISGQAGVVRALALSPDGKTLASGGEDGFVHLWDVASAQHVRRLEGHQDWVMTLAFSPNGLYLASGGFDGSIRLWNLGSSDKLPVIPINPPPSANQAYHVLALAYSPDGTQVAAGGTDMSVRIFDASNGNQIRAITGHTSSVTSLAFHASGAVLASGSRDRTVRLWNPANGQALKVLEGHQAWVNGIAFVERGTRLASVSADQTVRLWDLTPAK